MKTLALIFHFTVLSYSFSYAQLQLGMDIDGEAGNDASGYSVSMPDANTFAVGAVWNDGGGLNSGHVRVYMFNGNIWIQKGIDLDGESGGDYFGAAVSMPDANTIAVGGYFNDGNGTDAGHVRVFEWIGNNWLQKGSDLDGESAGDYSGFSVSMPDANTVAIGARSNDGSFFDAGHVRIYSWNGTSWIQKGNDIDGDNISDNSGQRIAMPDSNTVAIGAPNNDGGGTDAGHVRVYAWDGNTWVQKGPDIEGLAAFDYFGSSVSMPDTNTLAVGAFGNDGNGSDAGQVRIFTWDGINWIQKGNHINGEAAGDNSGSAISMPDANTIAIGAFRNGGNGSESGHVRLYSWTGVAWVQQGIDIDGEAAGDRSGISVSMPDASTVSIGATLNNGNGSSSGHVRVYGFLPTGITDTYAKSNIFIYPNPFSDDFSISLNEKSENIEVYIYDVMGKMVYQKKISYSNHLKIQPDIPQGIYFINVFCASDFFTNLKLIKK